MADNIKTLPNGMKPVDRKMDQWALRNFEEAKEARGDEYEYGELVSAWGYIQLAWKDIGYYQGDYLVLLRDGHRYGYLIIGYGSCSGCDALQGCYSYQEVVDLQTQLFDSIIWQDSAAELLKWLAAHDWQGDFIGSSHRLPEVIEEFTAVLAAEIAKGVSNE